MSTSESSFPRRDTWTFSTAGQLFFGKNAINHLSEVAQRLGCKRVLLVTDPIIKLTGLVEKVREPLEKQGVTIEMFADGEPEPSLDAVTACLTQARAFKPDALVALGGGSNMDLAKMCAVLMAHGGKPSDYFGDEKIPGPIAPLICIPTTAGTGSEISMASVLTDKENRIKVGVLSHYLRPRVAIVDPLMTVTCPPKVTADSGIDALTHAIEAYTAVDNEVFPLPAGERTVYQGKNPIADACAEKAIKLVGQHLRSAVADGNDLTAREGMSLAATLAGKAFSNSGVAAVHAMEYPVGGAVHCSHGAGNGLLLPFVMRFNMSHRLQEFAEIAGMLGEDTTGLDEQAAAEKAITAVEKLRADIGIPQRLRDLGVKEEQLRGFAEKAFSIRRVMRVNPREASVDDIEGIYRAAF